MELLARDFQHLIDIIAGNAADKILLWNGKKISSKLVKDSVKASISSTGRLINDDNRLKACLTMLLNKRQIFTTCTLENGTPVIRKWRLK